MSSGSPEGGPGWSCFTSTRSFIYVSLLFQGPAYANTKA